MLNALFHVSEEPGITEFLPRPSLAYYNTIHTNVVFAVSQAFMVNYLLPRDCPRIGYYTTEKTTEADRALFMGNTTARHVIIVESDWYAAISKTKLYCYELPPQNFRLIDECAGYYVSCEPVKPIGLKEIDNIIAELLSYSAELRFMPSLHQMADAVKASSLNFSIIRMRNAKPA